ncbi:hypothetical protein D3C75_682620 [compost metagenome]
MVVRSRYRLAHQHIFGHRHRKNSEVLKGRPEEGAVGAQAVIPDICPVQQQFTLIGVIEPHQQLDQGGFACAVVADKCDFFCAFNADADILQHGIVSARIGEADMIKLQ